MLDYGHYSLYDCRDATYKRFVEMSLIDIEVLTGILNDMKNSLKLDTHLKKVFYCFYINNIQSDDVFDMIKSLSEDELDFIHNKISSLISVSVVKSYIEKKKKESEKDHV